MLNIILPAFLAISTFLFLPTSTNFFYTPKLIALTLVTLVLIVGMVIKYWRSHSLHFPNPTFLKYAILFPLSLLLSFIFIKEARLESLLNYGLLYLLLLSLSWILSLEANKSKLIELFEQTLIILSSLLAFYTVLHLVYLYTASFLPLFMQTRTFTPTGSPMATLYLLVIGTAITLTQIFNKKNALSKLTTVAYPLLATIQIIAIMSYFSLLLPGQELSPSLLPYRAGWTILLDAWKSPRLLLTGVGLANFSSLFTQTKPLFLNTTSFWNTTFQQSSSELLQVFSTLGVLGGAGFISYLLYGLLRLKQQDVSPSLLPTLLLTTLFLLFLPGNILSLTIFFVTISLLTPSPASSPSNSTVRPILSLLILLPTLSLAFYVGKYALAEYYHYQSQLSLAKKDVQSVYRNEQKATTLLPYYANYRLNFAQINLALAGAISQKQNLSDNEKTTVTTLTSQAIQEAKVVTTLRPNWKDGYQNLATVYRNLIGVAQGADEFAINSLAKAVSLDPANPSLRLEFAGLLQQIAGKTENEEQKTALLSRSLQEYLRSVEVKPDYANGYYNISKLYESQGNIERATAAMTQAVAYLNPESTDYASANSELVTLKSKLPKTSPSPLPSPLLNPSAKESELTLPSPLPSAIPATLEP